MSVWSGFKEKITGGISASPPVEDDCLSWTSSTEKRMKTLIQDLKSLVKMDKGPSSAREALNSSIAENLRTLRPTLSQSSYQYNHQQFYTFYNPFTAVRCVKSQSSCFVFYHTDVISFFGFISIFFSYFFFQHSDS